MSENQKQIIGGQGNTSGCAAKVVKRKCGCIYKREQWQKEFTLFIPCNKHLQILGERAANKDTYMKVVT